MIKDFLLERGAKVGNDVFFGTNVYVDVGFERFLEIEDGVVIAHGVTVILHDSSLNNILGMPIKIGKVKICKNTYIGANATILCGVEIGENSLIGAGSLVTKNIPANTVAYGVPAKKICSLSKFKDKYIKKVNNKSEFFYWNVIPWRDRQKKLTPIEEQRLFFDFLYDQRNHLFNDAPTCLNFDDKIAARYLLHGWYPVENWPPSVRWTEKKSIVFLKNNGNYKSIKIKFFTNLDLEISVYVNNRLIKKIKSEKDIWQTLEGEINNPGLLEIKIELDRTWVPDTIIHNGDVRELGIAVHKIWLE